MKNIHSHEIPLLLARYLISKHRLKDILGVGENRLQSVLTESRELDLYLGDSLYFRNTDRFKAIVLYTICRITRPSIVVETGVASGYSSTGILAALTKNELGRLYSIDMPAKEYLKDDGSSWRDISRATGPGWLVPDKFKNRWSLQIGDSKQLLTELLGRLRVVDIFYHDSEHTREHMMMEFHSAWKSLTSNGWILADNINWNSAFDEFRKDNQGVSSTILFPYLGILRKHETRY